MQYVVVSPEAACAPMLSDGMAPWLADAFLKLFSIYRNEHGATVLEANIKQVTGFAPSSFDACAFVQS